MPPNPEGALLYDRIESNQRRTAVVVALFVAATLFFVGYLAMWFTALVVWLTTGGSSPAGHEVFTAKLLSAAVAVLAALPVLSYLGYTSSPRLLLRMVRARRMGPNEEPELKRVVENLSIGAGLPAPRLYVIESPSANAFATGLDPSDSAIVVTRGLLRLLDRSELEGVVAHEFSHIGNRDTRLNMVTAALVITLRVPVTLLRRLWSAFKRKMSGSAKEFQAALGLAAYGLLMAPPLLSFALFLPVAFWSEFGYLGPLMLLLPVHVFLLAPLLAPQVSRAISREREYLADADAVLLTRNPEGLARALTKISASSHPAYVHPAVAHLYIADPSSPAQNFSRTHPPIQERISRLAEMARIPLTALNAAAEAGAKYGQMEGQAAPEVSPPSLIDGAPEIARVIRLNESASLLQSPSSEAPPRVRLPESTLLITFEREGEFIQAVTAERVFGYLHESVSSSPVDMDPAEVQAHLPPPPPGQTARSKVNESQAIAIIVLLALVFFVVMLWVLLDLTPR